MRSGRLIRTLAVVASVGLIFGAFVAPAEAGKKKKKKPAGCAAFVPSEKGTGAPITIVTDAATAEAPVEVEVDTPAGLGTSSEAGEGHDDGATSHSYTNVQVDSAASSADLNVLVEFEPVWDYDLFVRDNSHAAMAYSAGFGPVGSGSDGQHSGLGTEQTPALTTPDCGGYTVDVSGATTPGGTVVVKYWLGA